MRLSNRVLLFCLSVIPSTAVLPSAARAQPVGDTAPAQDKTPASGGARVAPAPGSETVKASGGAKTETSGTEAAKAAKVTEAAKEAEPAKEVEAAKKDKEQQSVELKRGSLAYGITTTLLRLQSTRKASDPARSREYDLAVKRLPLDLGFQFSFRPKDKPYRLDTADKVGFQLISVGGMLSVTMNEQIPGQAEIILGIMLSFFDECVSLGLGFDLYRGIPVRGSDGVAGSATATTGLLGWAWSKQGEITPENFSLLLTFNLSKIAGTAGGGK